MEQAITSLIVFSAKNLKKIYLIGEIEVYALREINLELYAGEIVVLLGPSGSGKSTLLNILGGLDNPSSGEVFYKEHNLVTASPHELTLFRREHVGFVFQFYNLIPSLTAEENVALATEVIPSPMPSMSALELVGLQERPIIFLHSSPVENSNELPSPVQWQSVLISFSVMNPLGRWIMKRVKKSWNPLSK